MKTKSTLNWNVTYRFLLTEHRHLIKSSADHEMWLTSIIRLELLFMKLSPRAVKWLAQVEQLLNDCAMMGNRVFSFSIQCCALSLLYIRTRILLLLPSPFPPLFSFPYVFFFYFSLEFKSITTSKISSVCPLLISGPWIRLGPYQWQMLAISYSLHFLLTDFLQITTAPLHNTGEDNSVRLQE